MSTANFNSNQLGFSLYVHDNIYAKVCPECGAWNSAEDDNCYECGESLDGAGAAFRWDHPPYQRRRTRLLDGE